MKPEPKGKWPRWLHQQRDQKQSLQVNMYTRAQALYSPQQNRPHLEGWPPERREQGKCHAGVPGPPTGRQLLRTRFLFAECCQRSFLSPPRPQQRSGEIGHQGCALPSTAEVYRQTACCKDTHLPECHKGSRLQGQSGKALKGVHSAKATAALPNAGLEHARLASKRLAREEAKGAVRMGPEGLAASLTECRGFRVFDGRRADAQNARQT